MEFWQIVTVALIIFVLFFGSQVCTMLLTGWLIHKAQGTPGSPFFKAAKGEVFTIDDAGLEDEPDAEKNVLKRAEAFLGKFTGDNKGEDNEL